MHKTLYAGAIIILLSACSNFTNNTSNDDMYKFRSKCKHSCNIPEITQDNVVITDIEINTVSPEPWAPYIDTSEMHLLPPQYPAYYRQVPRAPAMPYYY